MDRHLLLLALLLPSAWTGCAENVLNNGKSPLKPAQMSPDSVAVDIIFVRCPFGDPEINEKLWLEVDEQALDPDVRRQLAAHGFRAGLIGNRMPPALEKLIEEQSPEAAQRDPGAANVLSLEVEPNQITGRYLQTRSGARNEIQTSAVYEDLSVLLPSDELLLGERFTQAQGVVVLRVHKEEDGRVRLELIPEVHHGKATNRYMPLAGEGAWMLQASRQRETFAELQIDATVSTGEMLLLTCQPGRVGSLGHRFFSDQATGPEQQKLLLVRLMQARPTGP